MRILEFGACRSNLPLCHLRVLWVSNPKQILTTETQRHGEPTAVSNHVNAGLTHNPFRFFGSERICDARLCAGLLLLYNANHRSENFIFGVSLMPKPNHIEAAAGDVLLLTGTMKGAFVLRSNKDRKQWEVGGPYFPGSAI